MNSKILIAAGIILAFVVGTMAAGFYSNTSKAFNATQESTVKAIAPVKSARNVAARTNYVEPRAVSVSDSAPAAVTASKNRSWKRSAMIVGGGAGAGAAIGAVSGGKKGAAIGAVSGGVAGLIYDMATRNKN